MITALHVLCSNLLSAFCAMYVYNTLLEINVCMGRQNEILNEVKACLREKNIIHSYIGHVMKFATGSKRSQT
jgi:hypothetical protein